MIVPSGSPSWTDYFTKYLMTFKDSEGSFPVLFGPGHVKQPLPLRWVRRGTGNPRFLNGKDSYNLLVFLLWEGRAKDGFGGFSGRPEFSLRRFFQGPSNLSRPGVKAQRGGANQSPICLRASERETPPFLPYSFLDSSIWAMNSGCL